jgi:hypothetical protein
VVVVVEEEVVLLAPAVAIRGIRKRGVGVGLIWEVVFLLQRKFVKGLINL